MIGSSEVNRVIRRIIGPALRDHGFNKVRTRHNWRYFEDRIWYVMIKAVGAHFSAVTGYPPASLVAEYGIYFTDFPPHPLPAWQMTPKSDGDGLALPREYECHFRASLNIIKSQKRLRKGITSPIERRRQDVWWIGRDGANMTAAVVDMKNALVQNAIPALQAVRKDELQAAWLGLRQLHGLRRAGHTDD